MIKALLTGPGLVFFLPYLFFRYHTLRYKFDEQGIHMRVGILFRKEVNVTYSRIQDIHLSGGLLQRWLGLANVQIQTASGSARPELEIEGFHEFELVRDFLYTRMRGYVAKTASPVATDNQPGMSTVATTSAENEMLALLHGIRDELRRTRELIESRRASSKTSGDVS